MKCNYFKAVYFFVIFAFMATILSAKTEILVSSATSLKDVMSDIKIQYEKNNPNIKITYNFDSPGSLANQIENGAPVDVFISAAKKQIDQLQNKSILLPDSSKAFLKNEIVLITPIDQKDILKLADLEKENITKIAIGEPNSVPAGQYAKETCTTLGLWDKLQPKLIFGKNVRQVLTYVETGNVDAGFVFATDAKVSKHVRTVIQFESNTHSPILYYYAVIKTSSHIDESKEFVNFLNGEESQAIFKQYGFGVVEE